MFQIISLESADKKYLKFFSIPSPFKKKILLCSTSLIQLWLYLICVYWEMPSHFVPLQISFPMLRLFHWVPRCFPIVSGQHSLHTTQPKVSCNTVAKRPSNRPQESWGEGGAVPFLCYLLSTSLKYLPSLLPVFTSCLGGCFHCFLFYILIIIVLLLYRCHKAY